MTPPLVNVLLAENPTDPILTADPLLAAPFPPMLDLGYASFRIRFGPA